MEDLIDGKRRIEAVVCRDEDSPGEASFSLTGTAAAGFQGAVPCSEAFADMLSGYGEQTLVSRREHGGHMEGRPYHVCLNRYIHLTLGELADIQARRFPDRRLWLTAWQVCAHSQGGPKRRNDGLAKG